MCINFSKGPSCDWPRKVQHNLLPGEIKTLLYMIKMRGGDYINIRAKLRIMRFDENNILTTKEIMFLLKLPVFEVDDTFPPIHEKLYRLKINTMR